MKVTKADRVLRLEKFKFKDADFDVIQSGDVALQTDEELAKATMKAEEDAIIKMLKKNGYKIPEPITAKFVADLCQKLAQEDKFVNVIRICELDGSNLKYTVIPFLDNISKPREEEVYTLYKKAKEKWDRRR